MADRHMMMWMDVDRIRRGIGEDSTTKEDETDCVLTRDDGVKLLCKNLSFEVSDARAASSVFDAVLPLSSNSLVKWGSNPFCCVMRDASIHLPSVSIAAALLCCPVVSKESSEGLNRIVEVCGLAVRSDYRGFKCVAANLFSYAIQQGLIRPKDKLTVHVQADNTSALRFYVSTLAMKPSTVTKESEEQPPRAKRSRSGNIGHEDEINSLAQAASDALHEYDVKTEQLKSCFVFDYYPPRPRCRFGSRHAFVLECSTPESSDIAVRIPWDCVKETQAHEKDV